MTESNHQYDAAFLRDLRQIIRDEVHAQISPIKEKIGEVNEDGDGGTGLCGQIARTNAKVAELFDLKNIGRGVLIAVMVTGGLLLLGVKSWVLELLHAR